MELLVLLERNLHTFSGMPDRFPTYWIIKLRPPSRGGRQGGKGGREGEELSLVRLSEKKGVEGCSAGRRGGK